jgi:hypothetical protein
MPPLHLFPQLLLLVLFLSADVTNSNSNSNSDSNSDSAELRTEAALKLLYAGLPDWPSSDADRTSIKSHTENTFGPDRCGMEPPRELHSLFRSWLSASGDFPLAAPLPFLLCLLLDEILPSHTLTSHTHSPRLPRNTASRRGAARTPTASFPPNPSSTRYATLR